MEKKLANKVAIVTGASKGIGVAIAEEASGRRRVCCSQLLHKQGRGRTRRASD